MLARKLGADTFIITTAVNEIYLYFGQEEQKPLRNVSLDKIKRYLRDGHFKVGSMKPKIEAVIQFLEAGGEKAIITSPGSLLDAVCGKAGTTIVR